MQHLEKCGPLCDGWTGQAQGRSYGMAWEGDSQVSKKGIKKEAYILHLFLLYISSVRIELLNNRNNEA